MRNATEQGYSVQHCVCRVFIAAPRHFACLAGTNKTGSQSEGGVAFSSRLNLGLRFRRATLQF